MSKNNLNGLSRYIAENRLKFMTSVCCILAGIIIGAAVGSMTVLRNSDFAAEYISNFTSAYNIHGISAADVWGRAFLSDMRIFFLIWLSGYFIWLVPLNLTAIFSKGFGLGYTISYLITGNGFVGFLLSVAALLPQNLILLPSFIIYSVYQINFAVRFRKVRGVPSEFKRKRRLFIINTVLIFAVAALSAACSLLEAYVIPVFVKLICGNFV